LNRPNGVKVLSRSTTRSSRPGKGRVRPHCGPDPQSHLSEVSVLEAVVRELLRRSRRNSVRLVCDLLFSRPFQFDRLPLTFSPISTSRRIASEREFIVARSKGARTRPSRPLFERFPAMFRSRKQSRFAPRKRSTSTASARTRIWLLQGGELRICPSS
jgi:hypothetical protein